MSLMADLRPSHHLIGSSAEATRLGPASEIDVFRKLTGLKKELFKVDGRALLLTNMGVIFFGKFNYFP